MVRSDLPPMRLRSLALLAAAAAPLLLLLLPGCPDDDGGTGGTGGTGPGCTLQPLGDVSAPIEMEVIALDPTYASQPVADGGVVHNLFPPQGGRVVFAGVRATNIDPCGVQLSGGIRDLQSQQVRFDYRTINLQPQADGWGASAESDIASFANIPTCPNQWSARDVFDQDYDLIVEITERSGRKASKTLRVRPVCQEPGFEAECTCICKAGYVLGEVCEPGTGGAGGAGGSN